METNIGYHATPQETGYGVDEANTPTSPSKDNSRLKENLFIMAKDF